MINHGERDGKNETEATKMESREKPPFSLLKC